MTSSASIRAGKATVEIAADNNQLGRDLRAAKEKFSAFGKSIGSLTGAIGAAISGGALTGGVLGAVTSFADAGSQLDDLSTRSGASAKGLSQLSLAAKMSDVSMEALGKGFKGMQETLVGAAQGGKKQVETLKALKLNIKDLTTMSPEQQFETFAQAISELDDPALRTAYSIDAFGKAGLDLLPLLAEGKAGIQAFRTEADELGITMSDEDASSAAAFGDALDKLKMTIAGVYNRIGAALAPALTKIVETISKVVGGVSNWINENRGLVAMLSTVVGGIGAALAIGGSLGATFLVLGPLVSAAFGVISTAVSAVVSAFAALAVPVGAALLAIGGVTAAIYGMGYTWSDVGNVIYEGVVSAGSYFGIFSDNAKSVLGSVVETFNWMYSGVKEYLGAIGTAIASGNISGAGQVAMAGLKSAFRMGFNTIYGYYLGFIEGFQNTWDSWTYGLSSVFIDAWTGIEMLFSDVTLGMMTAWDMFTGYLEDTWNSSINFIKRAWINLKGMFGVDVGDDLAAQEKVEEAQAKAREKRRTQFTLKTAERLTSTALRKQDLAKANIEAQKALKEEQEIRRKARSEASSKLMAEAEGELAKAKEAYQQTIETLKNTEPTISKKPGEGDESGKLNLKTAMESAGVFNVAAIQSIQGASGYEKEIAEATEKTAEAAKRTADATEELATASKRDTTLRYTA